MAKKVAKKTKKATKKKTAKKSVKKKVPSVKPAPEKEVKKSLLTNKEDLELRNLLLESAYLSESSVDEIENICLEEGIDFYTAALTHDFLTDDLIGQARAEQFGVPYADLNSKIPSKDQVLKIPEGIAKKYKAILFREGEKEAVITTDNPAQSGLKSAVQSHLKGKKISINYSLPEDIDNIFIYYRKDLSVRIEKALSGVGINAPEVLVEIFDEALVYKTSDIHLEPRKEEVMIRFRIDGVMKTVATMPVEGYDSILNRIKVMARMRIDEHNTTQDGAIRYDRENSEVDMRVSIAPTIAGEKVVIRLLAEYVKGFALSSLGLSDKDADILKRAIKKPFGMILVTGPTGSGKTTTLYALLKLLNKPTVNITTIEDPVEYKIQGVNQIKVDTERGVTFARGLRSIVRQDPDVILVGEIRDKETAEIAVNAALTGHLVLSTFHANDAATAIPRLIDMGIEPFLLSSTLELVIAQRLVRKISEECKESYSLSKTELEQKRKGLSKYIKPGSTVYTGERCGGIDARPYRGRTGIFEFIDINQNIKDLILKNPSTGEVWDIARKEGVKTLFEDGIEKVVHGVTSVDELLRVAEPPHDKKEKNN